MFTVDNLSITLQNLSIPLQHIWVAYSGGLDSHVLLHCLVQLRNRHPTLQLQAIHINHSLNPDAHQWVRHCQSICSTLKVPLHIQTIDPAVYISPNKKGGIEAIARHHRYHIFMNCLPEKTYLCTAHHGDDQAETVLLRLLRGTGIKGLGAMTYIKSWGSHWLIRPLLSIKQTELVDYAKREKLIWISDDSNLQTRFDRNYLRHQIIPSLQSRWPGATITLARMAQHCRENTQLLREIAAQDWSKAQGKTTATLSVKGLKQLSHARQKNLLRLWLEQLNLPLPSSKQLQQLCQTVLTASKEAKPLLFFKQVEIRRFLDEIYAIPALLPHDPTLIITWDMHSALLQLPAGIGYLTCKEISPAEVLPNSFFIPADYTLTIRFRCGGERFHPAGHMGSHPLKKLWQEWHVPPWQRDRIPLCYVEGVLKAIPGYAVSQDNLMALHRRGSRVLIEFIPNS